MRRLVLVLALLVSLTAGACGSDDDGGTDEEQVRAVYRDYLAAIADGDAEAACGLLTEDSQQRVATEFESCEAALASTADFGEKGRASGEVRLTDLDVSGDEATAQARHPYGNEPLLFEQADGEWRLRSGG